MKYLTIILLCVFTISFFSCEIDPNMKKKERMKYIEKVVKDQTKFLETELDSLCDLNKKENFNILVDSIIDVRLADIRRKMKEK